MSIAKPVIKIAALTLLVMSLVGLMFGLTIAQEVPTGTVKGRLLDEHHKPLAQARVVLRLSEESGDESIRGTTDEQGYFVISDVPAGSYMGYASARGYESANLSDYVPFTVCEGKSTLIKDVVMYPRPPSIYGGISSTFTPSEAVTFSLNGYSRKPVAVVKMLVYSFDFAQEVRKSEGRFEGSYSFAGIKKKLGEPLYERTIEIATDSEGYFSRSVTLPLRELGGYLVNLKLETTEALLATNITDLALVTKRAPGKILVYATSYTNKAPVKGVNLEFFTDTGKLSVSGRTDANGIFEAGTVPENSITVLGEAGESKAAVRTYGDSEDERSKCYIYTDRPIYRPGHTVMFKGILRGSQPGSLSVVANQTLTVKVTDPDGTAVKTLSLVTNRFGTFGGSVTMSPDAKPGHYSVETEFRGERHEQSFVVEEYRKPEFRTAVSFSKPRYVAGETAVASVGASYYFGGPVAGAKVTYTIYKSPDYFEYYPGDSSDSEFYEELYYGEDYSEYGYGGYGEVVLEGEGITDESGVLKVRMPTTKASAEQRYSIEASVMDASGRSIEVSGGVMVTPGLFALSANTEQYMYKPNKTARVNVYSVDYDLNRIPNVNATASVYRSDKEGERTGKPLLVKPVRTDANGEGQFTFSLPDQGFYWVVIRCRDQEGNAIEDTSSVYIADDTYAGDEYTPPALELTVDKKIYKTGETARVMVSSPVEDSYVLLTVEGRRLFRQQVLHLTSPTKIIEVPLPGDYSPNAYVCATLVDGKHLATKEVPVPISPEGKFLNVKIESDKQRYLPGENATYTIRTTNQAGKGVPAEVSLGVVDESIYALREDTTPDIKRFFHGPVQNSVGTSFSYSDYYLGGEDKFQGKVRKYFPDTAYWNPSIVTDENGNASVTFKMPDNLTQWRATARAVSEDTAVGSAKHKVTVRKNILVRLQAPRFFRQRDELVLTSVVHNYTGREQNIKVWLEADGIAVDGSMARNVVVASDGSAVVSWNARAEKVGTAKLTVYAKGQRDQDAMQMEAPVLPHGVPDVVSTAGDTKSTKEFVLDVSGSVIPDASELRFGFSSSVAGAALGITDAIEDYEMESPEFIMDVLLPNVVMYQAMDAMGSNSQARMAKMRRLVSHDLKLVYDWQLPGGGWGWSKYGEKDPWMTAYVVYGLIRAYQAGLPVDQGALKRGVQATIESLPDVGDLGKRATMVYVLALAGEGKREWVDPILNDKKLQNYSLSLMILALAEMGDMARAKSLVPKLVNGGVESDRFCSWPESFPWGFYSCNEYETTAYAVRALLAVDPENPCITKGVRWMVNKRKGDRFNANYDTASVVYALADYLKAHNPEPPDYQAKVFVNGKLVREFEMGPESITAPELDVKLTGDVVHGGRNIVRIEKTGPGELFYWANLKYYSADENVPVRDGKIKIRREYYRLKLVKDREQGLVYKPFPLGGSARVGELIRCRLVVTSPKDFRYLIVEDYLPCGCEVVDRSVPSEYGYEDYEWDYWWGGETVYDNRVMFHADYAYKGKRVIEYDFRPEIKGTFHAMPATAQGWFEPDIYAHSDERRLTVR